MGMELAPLDQRIFGAGHYLRPSLFQPYECRSNLLIEGVTFKDSPFWTVHPVFCNNVTVAASALYPAPPTMTESIPIPAATSSSKMRLRHRRRQHRHQGRTRPGRLGLTALRKHHRPLLHRHPFPRQRLLRGQRNVRQRPNVFIENNKVGDVQSALYVKSNSDRGGTVENIWMRNTVETCDWFIKIETDYKGITGHPYPSAYRNFHFEDLTCKTARECGIYSVGINAKPVAGLTFKNVTVETRRPASSSTRKPSKMTKVRINGTLL